MTSSALDGIQTARFFLRVMRASGGPGCTLRAEL